MGASKCAESHELEKISKRHKKHQTRDSEPLTRCVSPTILSSSTGTSLSPTTSFFSVAIIPPLSINVFILKLLLSEGHADGTWEFSKNAVFYSKTEPNYAQYYYYCYYYLTLIILCISWFHIDHMHGDE
jgi:hypothetical protein